MSDLANVRRGRDFTAYFRFGRRAGARRGEQEKPLPLGRQLLLQAILLVITIITNKLAKATAASDA